MKIRTQLVVTFFLLAVVPLASIVAFNYISSLRAVRRAVQEESAELTLEMERRMTLVREDLALKMSRVGSLPFGRLMSKTEEEAQKRELMGRALNELGEAAPLVERFEFVPSVAPERPPRLDRSPLPPDVPMPGVAPPPPPPARGPVMFDFTAVMDEIEEELEELPPEERAEILEQARAGMEAAVAVAETIDTVLTIGSGDDPDEAGADEGSGAVVGFLERAMKLNEGELRQRLEEMGELEELSRNAAEEEQLVVVEEHRQLQESLHEQLEMSEFKVPVRESGRLVGEVKARLSVKQLLWGVLSMTRRDQGEIPFALDSADRLFTASEEDRDRLAELPIQLSSGAPVGAFEQAGNWVVVTSEDEESGLTFGIARPISDSLAEIRTNSARNFAFGAGLILLSLLIILPISGRMTRSLQLLTDGAQQIAGGDLDTRVPVRSRNEIGKLATAFNQMAGDLHTNHERLVEETRLRHDQEVQQRLLQAEYDRKSEELEDARLFQLSLLPKELPAHPSCEIAVFMETATEVGGDYYDFKVADDVLIAAVGDATGHGARAGTMVTVIKSLFSAASSDTRLNGFLEDAGSAIRRMELGRMAMALVLARLEGSTLTLSSAGMPPPLLARAGSGKVEEIDLTGMPLGGLASSYREVETSVLPGDTLLLMSDGFPELPNVEGDPIGYDRVQEIFEASAAKFPDEIIQDLSAAAADWVGHVPPNDDVTFVVMRVREQGAPH
jgi:serine phosphatase RsbU (regulator of sigma subunit)